MIKKILLINFSLLPTCFADNPTVIPDVVVAAPINTTPQNAYSAETATISAEQMLHSGDVSLSDVLANQSALRVIHNSGNSEQSSISIRGFGDNAVANSLILVDGFPLMNASLLAPNFNAIALGDIQKIDLFQGSQGSLWGNQAVGGVLSIQTRVPQEPIGNVSVSYGSYDSPQISALYGDKRDSGFFYKISAYGSTTDNYQDHNQQSDSGLNLQQGWDYATGSWSFNEKVSDNTTHFPGSLTQAQYEADPTQATDTKDYVHYQTQIFQVLNKQWINDQWHVETRVSTTHVSSNGYFYNPYSGSETLNWFNPQVIGHYQGMKIISGYVGQTSQYQETTTPPAISSAANANENDLYSQFFIPLTKKWALTLGAREAVQSNSPQLVLGETTHYRNQAFVTEQGLNYRINEGWSWFVRRDGNFRMPKANEEVWLASDATELKVQTGVSYESGVLWQTRQHKIQFSVYELLLHNEIAYDPTQTPTQPFGATSNFEATLRKGINFSQESHVTEHVSLNTSLNYVDARFVAGPDSGNVVPGVPMYHAVAGADYLFQPHWKTLYNEIYTGTVYASDDVQNVATRVPAYWLGQWGLEYVLKKVSVSFKIDNLFNQRYAVFTDYDSYSQANMYYPGAGRSYTLSIKAQL